MMFGIASYIYIYIALFLSKIFESGYLLERSNIENTFNNIGSWTLNGGIFIYLFIYLFIYGLSYLNKKIFYTIIIILFLFTFATIFYNFPQGNLRIGL